MHTQAKRILIAFTLTFAAAFAFAGCGTDLGDCPTDSTAAAQKTAGEAIVTNKCATAGCHTSANGANPASGLDFSTASSVTSNAGDMYSEAEAGSMPPTGKLSATDLEALRVYLACTQ